MEHTTIWITSPSDIELDLFLRYGRAPSAWRDWRLKKMIDCLSAEWEINLYNPE